ncbi:MFS transporter [Corynebacterium afermentans subsp. lipophilum]|uniref:MFS transporter n=1 Tax=Corynebacterium afermentans TaxID=38286 RepID=UPI00188BBB55|nr:MFS transporter [Corynebacterium afermentans]MBF4547284.1 MFS transporter [Corynebacterium afermentans subsp. lipophilum]WJY57844.1 Methyl viologen resistance protein SmvA [Corynebacterium afermentans subsp. lipophilum]
MTKAQRWGFFAVVSLGLLMIGLDNSILYTALPALEHALGAGPEQGLWIINAYPLVLSGLLLGTGALGDRVGHRLMFIVGLTIFGLASLGAAFAPGPLELIVARGILGMGAAVMMPATLALIRLTFPDERERNTAIGIWGSVAVAGGALGPVVGGALIQHFWVGSVFLINVPIVVIALVLTVALAPENLPNPDKQWDVVSSFYALVALSGLTMAIKQAAQSPASTLAALAAAAVGAWLFVRRQHRLVDPLLTFDIFRSRLFTGGVLAAAGGMFVLAGAELMTTQKLQLVDALTPLTAGATVAVMALSAIPASVLGGAYLHKIGFLPLITGGFFGAVVGAVALATGWTSIGMVLLGLSAGSVMSVSSIAIIGSAPMHRSGMAAGVEEVSYELGTLVTVALTGSLLQAALDRGVEYTDAYNGVIGVLAAGAACFAVATWWCFRDNPKSGGVDA